MAFEFRSIGTEWSVFDSSTINLRYTLWTPNLDSIEEKNLNIHKIIVKKDLSLTVLESRMKETLGIP